MKKSILICWFISLSALAFAQQENVILKAMKDEMNRTLTDVRYEGHDKPFYISYNIDDTHSFNVYSSLGSIFGARDFHHRQKGIRILVGDYEFNDESLDNNTFSDPTSHEIDLPLDDDYYGIRRALWTSTDAVYKGAAQKFKKHQATLKEKAKPLADLPHRSFAKMPAVQLLKPIPAHSIDKTVWENYCKILSGMFKEIPELESSSVMLSFNRTTRYFVNSEGTTAVLPEALASIHVSGVVKAGDDEESQGEQIVKYGATLDELPTLAEMKKEISAMIARLKQATPPTTLEEEYRGPVLFIGEPVVQVFSQATFSLNAPNNLPGRDNYSPEQTASIENKVGKAFIDNTITIKATPKLKTYEGKTLFGSFDMDAEGVVPPDEVVLVEKGILKNLMNDRSLTKAGQVANGFNDGPGVVHVSIEGGKTLDALKQNLIAKAKEEGLDFALIARGKSAGMVTQLAVYKVDLQTGAETLVGRCRANTVQPKDLKRISGTTSKGVHNLPLGRSNIASFIVPEAVLIEQAEIVPMKMPAFMKDEVTYVDSPLRN